MADANETLNVASPHGAVNPAGKSGSGGANHTARDAATESAGSRNPRHAPVAADEADVVVGTRRNPMMSESSACGDGTSAASMSSSAASPGTVPSERTGQRTLTRVVPSVVNPSKRYSALAPGTMTRYPCTSGPVTTCGTSTGTVVSTGHANGSVSLVRLRATTTPHRRASASSSRRRAVRKRGTGSPSTTPSCAAPASRSRMDTVPTPVDGASRVMVEG